MHSLWAISKILTAWGKREKDLFCLYVFRKTGYYRIWNILKHASENSNSLILGPLAWREVGQRILGVSQ